MHGRSTEDLVGTLAANGVFLQTKVSEDRVAIVTIYSELVCSFGIPRRDFAGLHHGYKPTPEVYLSKSEFDRFFPPD
jgi:hypothetical protein